ncbi:hypothetical protein ES319_D12G073000v1 [Gossypium barbadense]|uniref:TF-B3 domain-containing protein n=2 Tax=Gossypium barbadense TaxID=3634 RepID=A0A5J5NVS8_GOSBA|nr:hypothetical protein ES319_D12G073000v1 [Gossypium barbadense]KAB1998204.1 hypothetical protein ES319_D12G073000v1 [Gossypium barbadense]
MVLMRPSSVCYKYRMVIPLDFALKFLPKHNCNLTLCNSAGKTWPMMFYRNTESKKLSAQLYGGWKTFVKDNRINVGDICVFELVRQPEILMKVQIYPAAKNASNACRSQADNSIASQLRTGSLVSVTEPDCQQTRCPYSSSELKDSKLKTQKNINFQYSTKELRGEFRCSAKHDNGGVSGDWGCLKPDLLGKMQPLTPTEKQRAADIASWSSSRLVSGKSKAKSHLPCPLPQKKMRIDSPNQHGQNSKLEVLSSGISSDGTPFLFQFWEWVAFEVLKLRCSCHFLFL